MSKNTILGVSPSVFLIIILGILGAFLFPVFAIMVLVPVVGVYVWQLRAKAKELEERLAALEGHRKS